MAENNSIKGPVYLKKTGEWAEIVFDLPDKKVNVLSTPVMKSFSAVLDSVEKDKEIKGILITSAKEGIFIAGGDIEEIQSISTEEEGRTKARAGQDILNRIADLNIPSAAVINGAALGGGMELALACRYRIAGEGSKIIMGLPEVRLGLIPGFGGTWRLPRTVGLLHALKMVPAGKVIGSRKAFRIGLVDKLVPDGILHEESVSFLKAVIAAPPAERKPKKTFLERVPFGKRIIYRSAAGKAQKKSKGFYPAVPAAVRAVCRGFGDKRDNALRREADIFGGLCFRPAAKNLMRVFFMSEKYKHRDWGVRDVLPVEVKKCGVIGAGLMGGGIAHIISRKDIPVRMKDISVQAVAKGMETARSMYEYPLKIKKIKPNEVMFKMGLISGAISDTGFRNADIIIEAVTEDINIKEKVFRQMDSCAGAGAILATNTSSLPVSKMAEEVRNPERVVGMHFFNPADRMPLLEVVKTKYTSPEVISSVLHFARRLGKMPIVVKDSPGFVVNRILLPYMTEGAAILAEGCSISSIDCAMTAFGMPMGPLFLADTIGLDVCYKVAKILEQAFGDRMKVPHILSQIKGLGGFYRNKKPSRRVYKVVKRRKKYSPDVIQKRIIYNMIDEAARILEEGIADAPDTIDIGLILGAGFPPHTAGLLRYADSVGINNVVKGLREFGRKPCGRLLDLSKNGRGFYGNI